MERKQDKVSAETFELTRETVERLSGNAEQIVHANGTREMICELLPRKFRNSNGEWEEIDDSLEEVAAMDEDDFEGLENRANDFKVRLAKNLKDGRLIRVRKGEHEIEWMLAERPRTATGRLASRKGHYKALNAKNGGGEVRYNDFAENADLVYHVQNGAVKEDIIVKAKSEKYEYTFLMKTKNVELMLDEGGHQLRAMAGGEQIFFFPVPVMHDAAGNFSHDVRYSLIKQGDDEYLLTVAGNAEWANAEGRVFPLTIDPSVSSGSYGYRVVGSNCAPNVGKIAGRYSNGNYYRFQFKMSGVSSFPGVVDNASLEIHGDKKINLYVGRLTSSYDSQCFAGMTDKVTTSCVRKNGEYVYTANIKKIVQSWQQGTMEYGLVILGDETSSSGYTYIDAIEAKITYTRFADLNQTVPGIEKAKGASGGHSLDMECGEIGSSSVDLYTGRHRFNMPLFRNAAGMQISLVYNSDYKDEIQYGACLGYGWRLSLLDCLAAGNGTYAYIDGFGFPHVFSKMDRVKHAGTTKFDNTVREYYQNIVTDKDVYMSDEGYRYIKVGTEWRMYLTETSYMTFDSTSKLVKKIYNGETAVTTTFNYTNNKIASITYDSNKKITFGYDGNGYLTSITKGEEVIGLSYISNMGLLSSVQRNVKTFASFEYSARTLKSTIDGKGYYLSFDVSSDKITKVSEFSKYKSISANGVESGPISGNTWSINYLNRGRTRVVDRNGVSTDYLFGAGGRSMAVADMPTSATGPIEIQRGKVKMTQFLKLVWDGDIRKQKIVTCEADLVGEEIRGRVFATQKSVSNGTVYETISTQNCYYGNDRGLYVFCCWVKGNSKTGTLQYEDDFSFLDDYDQREAQKAKQDAMPRFGVRVRQCDVKGSSITSFYVPLDETNQDWQFVAVPIDVQAQSPTSIKIELDYRNNSGTAYIQNGALYRTDGTATYMYDRDYSITYDKYYNKVTLFDLNGRSCKTILRMNNSEIATATRNYRSTTSNLVSSETDFYRITTGNLVSSETDFYRITTAYGYDSKRRVTSKRVSTNDLTSQVSCSYDDNTSQVSSQTDECGITSSKTYDAIGNVLSAKMSDGGGQYYSWEGSNLKEVSSIWTSGKNSMEYMYGLPVKFKHGNVEFAFKYDGFGRVTEVKENGVATKSIAYTDYSSNVGGVAGAVGSVKITYANGFEQTQYFDKFGRPLSVKENGTETKNYTYNNYNLVKTVDKRTNSEYTFSYSYGKPEKIVEKKDNEVQLSLETSRQAYSGSGVGFTYITGSQYSYGGNYDTYGQSVNCFGQLTNESTPVGSISYEYDSIGRLKSKIVGSKKTEYSYTANGLYTTSLVSKVLYSDGKAYSYLYDNKGNIKQISNENGSIISSYEYDKLNRLSRENVNGQYTRKYAYDERGNITSKTEYYFTVGQICESHKRSSYTYTYDGDRLKSYNGKNCVYDANGNPTTYLGKPLRWTRGRLLESFNGTQFEYNAEGIRTKKGNTEFILAGEKIVAEKKNGVITKRYFYDASGIAGMWFNGANYIFRKNLQGDVVGICDSNGNLLGSYTYDAWGKILSIGPDTIFEENPFRYRGYYYDTETQLYYLQTRYYDPETGRFLNEGAYSYLKPETVNGLNLYAYCLNNPVMGGRAKRANSINTSSSAMKNCPYGFQGSNNVIIHSGSDSTSNVAIFTNKAIANKVWMTNASVSLVDNKYVTGLIGNISFTTTKQYNEPGVFYSFINIGSNNSVGVGFNWGWYGQNIYVSNNIGVGSDVQIGDFTLGGELSIKEGITVSAGISSGDTTNGISVNIGWITMAGLAVASVISTAPVLGARIVGGICALGSFIVDIFI